MQYQIGRFSISIPDDHKLPNIQSQHKLYDVGWAGVMETICASEPNRPVIDIGANIGDTAALIRTHAKNPIICIEGNKVYTDQLRENIKTIDPSIAMIDKFVTARRAPSSNLRYHASNGTGGLTAAEHGVELEASDFVSLATLRDWCRGHTPSARRSWPFQRKNGDGPILFKTDTDGFDQFIIDEAIDVFSDTVFFFEYDVLAGPSAQDLWSDIFGRMEARGYDVILFDNFGFPMLCAEKNVGRLISDLTGYAVHQRRVGAVRIYYYDIFAFPPSMKAQYKACEARLRKETLAKHHIS